MKTRIFAFFVIFAGLLASCGTHKSSAYGDRESVVINVETGGIYAVSARGRAIKHDVLETSRYEAMASAKRKAVQDMLFKIMPTRNIVDKTLKPILMEVNVQQKNEDYFNAFFAKNGPWKEFVKNTGTRATETLHFSKTGNEMVVDMTVYVDRAALKQRMIDDGILR